MDEQEQWIFTLLEKYEQGKASPDEVKELEAWYQTFDNKPDYMETLSADQLRLDSENMHKRITAKINQEWHPKVHAYPARQFKIWSRIMVAASILVVATVGIYLYINKAVPVEQSIDTKLGDFTPGSNTAILTLSGGKRIVLKGAKNGQLATEGSTVIQKTADGKVIYDGGKNDVAVLNTMTTPRGGQYQLALADGTVAWLNAASSITYPTAFNGKDRSVEITGEVYFEVAHNAAKPFYVKSGDQIVKVLGTHFNINAYNDESSMKTTLLEGSVAITSKGQNKILKPGEQAKVSGAGIRIEKVDVAEATAWKDGYFDFTDADIATIMRQFSRWYNVDIEFQGPMTKDVFSGRLPRSLSLSKVMKIVQSSKSGHIEIEGRRIMVKQ